MAKEKPTFYGSTSSILRQEAAWERAEGHQTPFKVESAVHFARADLLERIVNDIKHLQEFYDSEHDKLRVWGYDG